MNDRRVQWPWGEIFLLLILIVLMTQCHHHDRIATALEKANKR